MAENIATFLGEGVTPEDHMKGVKRKLEYNKKIRQLQYQLQHLMDMEDVMAHDDELREQNRKAIQPEIDRLLRLCRQHVDQYVEAGCDKIERCFDLGQPGMNGKGKGKGNGGATFYSVEQREEIALSIQSALRCSGFKNASFYYNEDDDGKVYILSLIISTSADATDNGEELRTIQSTGLKGNCGVCYEEDKDMLIMTPCGHMTCSGCHQGFLNKACPFCRKTVTGFQGAFPN